MALNTSKTSREGRLYAWTGTALTALILSTSGCVSTSEEPPSEQTSESDPSPEAGNAEGGQDATEILASSTTTATEIGSDLQIDIHALERVGDDLLRLRLTASNSSPDNFILGYSLSDDNNEDSAGDITLIDSVNQQRYLSYDQSDGSCFCNSLEGNLESGSTEDLWVMFPAPPNDVESMTVVTPVTPPMMDIPISTSSETVENNNLAAREVLDLTFISDSLEEDQTGRTESGEEVSILLSSDVLFDTNKSDLNDEAQEILQQVAQEIDDASAETVSIDGYADNTGNNSINLPLSEDRAGSVESTLNDLITREGISFEVEGHGSADPIADNDTEEGRERNRRVSVTFEK